MKRIRVADQAAGVLRDALRNGELTDPLPGQHQLARQLGISRPSLRAALALLASEGLVETKKGHRSRVTKRRKDRAPTAGPAVCVVCPVSPESLYFQEHPVLAEMNAEFASRGIRCEVVFESRAGGAHPEAWLEHLVAARSNVCWLLFSAPELVHRWFVLRKLPTLVVGSCAPGVKLTSVDVDYGAVGWHAAGVLLRHRHKRIALVLPPEFLPGDVATRNGFLRYVEQQPVKVSTVEWSGSADLARRRTELNRLLTGPLRPTALVTFRPALTFAVLLQAPTLGLKIPQDLSLISRDSHPFFDWTVPDLSRYRSMATKLARRAVRLATGLLARQSVPARANLVTPAFFPGNTIAGA